MTNGNGKWTLYVYDMGSGASETFESEAEAMYAAEDASRVGDSYKLYDPEGKLTAHHIGWCGF